MQKLSTRVIHHHPVIESISPLYLALPPLIDEARYIKSASPNIERYGTT